VWVNEVEDAVVVDVAQLHIARTVAEGDGRARRLEVAAGAVAQPDGDVLGC
jgi:hypothetical protein